MRKFTKCHFFMSLFGFVTYILDTGVDFFVAFQHLMNGQYIAALLTLTFILLAMIILQVFSYSWFKDDYQQDEQGNSNLVAICHLFQCGIHLRYYNVIKCGCAASFTKCRWKGTNSEDDQRKMIYAITDLSMLRLFETFLESIPQLILQIYFLIEHQTIPSFQHVFLVVAFCSTSWSAVDYQMSLRKSLPEKELIRVGFPMVTFLSYKVLTLTSWTLSLALFGHQSIYFLLSLIVILWILSFSWTWKQKTEFCKSTAMEVLYRAVVGIILVFTFFNVRGEKTKIPIFVYYIFRVFLTASILLLCFYWNPSITEHPYFLPTSITIVMGLGLGIISLILYYGVFHPKIYNTKDTNQDTVDGLSTVTGVKPNRMQQFIML